MCKNYGKPELWEVCRDEAISRVSRKETLWSFKIAIHIFTIKLKGGNKDLRHR